MSATREDLRATGRGHDATRIRDIPWAGWKQILQRVRDEIKADRLSMVAAGIAFFAFLAVFPGLSALVSIWGLLSDAAQVSEQMASLRGAIPPEGLELLTESAQRVAETSTGGLTLSLAVSVLVAGWSANKGMKGLIEGITIAYDENESDRERGFILGNLLSLGLTFGAIIFGMAALGVIVAMPLVFERVGVDPTSAAFFKLGRWPALALFVTLVLAFLYRIAPPREDPKWRWVTPGSALATVLWLVASIAFSAYSQNFGSYDKTYGSLAAVIVLLLWLQLSAFIILLGAELNAETEKQTARDSTTGPERPMGEREAIAADTVEGAPES